MLNKKQVIKSLLASGIIGVTSTMALDISNLRCEYLSNPMGIDSSKPRLSWILKSSEREQKQNAYQVLVASAKTLLDDNRGDLWDSGKVISNQTNQISYEGTPLHSRMQCFWKVMSWDKDDKPSEWSPVASWSMGLLKTEDWQGAKWIGYDAVPARKKEPKDSGSPKVEIIKVLYGVPNEDAKQVDLTEKVRKIIADGKFELNATNDFAGKDPAASVKKKLILVYKLNGIRIEKQVEENEQYDIIQEKSKSTKRYLPSQYLRKEFKARSKVKRAVVYATAQGVFELHLNGNRVGDEYLMPGWTDYKKRIYYRTYDVTDLLKKGPNALGAILADGWFRGNISCIGQNQYGKKLRLKAQLQIEYTDGNSESIVSDPSWKASFGPIIESDMQAGETYDARLEMPGWDQAGFDDCKWSAVNTGSTIKPLIQAYPGDPVCRTMELATVKMTEPQKGNFVFDLGQNFSGWIRLKVKGKAGDKVVMRFAEMLHDDGTVYTANLRSARATDTYILKGGKEEVWEPHFTFHGFRYVELTGVPGQATPGMVTGIVTHSDSPISSSFECSNPMLNKIHSNIVWGQRSNYLEVPTDCPQRDERLGWTGDTQVFIQTGCYNQNVSAFFTKWMVDLMDTQDKEGLFGNQAPVFHGHGAAAWACAGIICPWTIYKVYGDSRMIEENYDAMARYLKACGKDGLGGRKAHTWGDWLAPGHRPPGEFIATAYYAYCTSLMVEMAEVIGRKKDAEKYKKLFKDIRAYFQKKYVAADGKIANDLQTVYCMALYFNLLTDQQRKQAEKHLVRRIKAKNYHLSVGFLGIPILLPTLTNMGRSDLAYRIIQQKTFPSWGYSIEQGATTIWERWNSYTKKGGFGDVKMNSFNHYSLGACGEWMFRSMLGIDSDGAGFKKIIMKPEIPARRSLGEGGGNGITWAKGHYDSIYGRIESDWKLKGNSFSWKVSIPANTTATVYVPCRKLTDLKENGRSISNVEGIKFLRMENDKAVLSLGSGDYSFDSPVNDMWQASWIGASGKSKKSLVNQWSCFRKVVHLDKAPANAEAKIAVDSKYWLWINGKLVVFEGQLKRGPNPKDTYFDRVDLTTYLRKGDNTIAVLLWYFGKHGFSHKSSGKPGLVFDAEVDGKPLLSDKSWKARIHPAFGNTGNPHPNFRLPESNVHFDAGQDIMGWQNPDYDDSAWQNAAEYGVSPCAPWNNLVERPIPLWKDFGLKGYVNSKELPKVSDGKVIKAKLPYNAQVTPYLKISGPAGKLIDIRMDNYKGGGPENVRAEYVTKEGVQEYESLGWMNGHEVYYKIPAGFKILALKYRETGYNTEFTGTFKCDDDFLNRYRQKALRTLYITMRDTYYDCPDRERAQWWGDMVNEMGEAFYTLDPRSNGLAKKGILELANWQRRDNTIFSPVPAGNWNRELPMQMLNSIGYYGFWTYYLYTGDIETIRAVYPAVKRYLSIWKLKKNGLVKARKGGWTWGDWGHNKDMTILYNGWYYLALKGQLNMARVIGETGDVKEIEAKMKSIEQNFNKTFWNGKEYRSPGYKDKTDDRAHALAVLCGLAKPEQYDAIRSVFKTQEHSSPYMEKYVGEALYQMRFEEDAIARTKKRFKHMSDHHFTTLWEDWRIGGSGGGTINHAWCGGALTLLSQYGAGVAPVKPGYETYHVLPQMGPLKHIKTTVPSVKGDINLELRNKDNSFIMNLVSPEGTTAIIGIPKEKGINLERIEVNKVSVWCNGKAGQVLKGLTCLDDMEHYIRFSTAPGKWTIKAQKKK